MMKTYPSVIDEDGIKYEFIFFESKKMSAWKNA